MVREWLRAGFPFLAVSSSSSLLAPPPLIPLIKHKGGKARFALLWGPGACGVHNVYNCKKEVPKKQKAKKNSIIDKKPYYYYY